MLRIIEMAIAMFYMVTGMQSPAAEAAAVQAPPETHSVSMAAVGDNLIHDVIYWQAKQQDGSYDFTALYEHVAPLIEEADLAVINQETPMAEGEPSSYPMFNTPSVMAAHLRNIGFDVLSVSNNHMLDQGSEGLAQTIRRIRDTEGLTQCGAHLDSSEWEQIPIVEKNGIRIAFLGFTQHTNGINPLAERADMIPYTDNTEELELQISLAREQADAVIVSVHWGDEGSLQPNAYQKELAQAIADLGADVILGTHPHVLQPVETLERADGGSCTVLYSLGNFVSAQVGTANLVGAIAHFTLVKEGDEPVRVEGLTFTPLVTHYGSGYSALTVYPLSDYTAELAAGHGMRAMGNSFSLEGINAVLEETILPSEN
ncbi:MAG: CapA family protein [Oscillospiraceae bacterium]